MRKACPSLLWFPALMRPAIGSVYRADLRDTEIRPACRNRIDGSSRRCARQAGITLIELLIVMTILAFAAGVIIANAPPARSEVRVAAEAFADDVQGLVRRAALDGGVYRLVVTEAAYRAEQRAFDDWQPVQSFPAATFDNGLFLTATVIVPLQSNALGLNGERTIDRSDDRGPQARTGDLRDGRQQAGSAFAADTDNRTSARDRAQRRRARDDRNQPEETYAIIDPIGAGGVFSVRFQRGNAIWTVARSMTGEIMLFDGEAPETLFADTQPDRRRGFGRARR